MVWMSRTTHSSLPEARTVNTSACFAIRFITVFTM